MTFIGLSHIAVQNLHILLQLPVSGWAELPQEVLSVGRAGGGSSRAAAVNWGHSALQSI